MIKNQGAREDQRAFTLMMQMILILSLIFLSGFILGLLLHKTLNQL